MTTDDIVIKLEQFRSQMPVVRDRAIIDAVYSATALAKKRVINDRETSTGGVFGIYSKNYHKKRIAKGKGPDPRINFSYTGRMWQSTTPVIVSTDDDEVRIKVAPLDPQRNRVMGYHDKKYNEIMNLSKKETDLIIELFHEELQNLIDDTIHN